MPDSTINVFNSNGKKPDTANKAGRILAAVVLACVGAIVVSGTIALVALLWRSILGA